jgi:hypothetical protein
VNLSSVRPDGVGDDSTSHPSWILALMPATLIHGKPVAQRQQVNPFGMPIRRGLVLIIMMLPALALANSALPKGFVYLRDILISS